MAILNVKTEEFFTESVRDSASRAGVKLPAHLEVYIVGLLSSTVTDKLPIHQPVFDLFKKAVESVPYQKLKFYKEMGDSSLIISGIFPRMARRRNVSVEYYIDMGQMGYCGAKDVAETVYKDREFGSVYGELSQKFKEIKNVLNRLDFRQINCR